jgi:pimeloyl-ACP methyl ester carboxylesterase
MRRAGLLLAACLALPAGCARIARPTAEELGRGYILLLPGVECTDQSMVGVCRGLREGGVDDAIDFKVWGYRPFGTFRNLPAYELNRDRARRVADTLVRYRATRPGPSIRIIGFSGGGAMALFVAEALPADFGLERIVLLGAALSPTYDFRPALSRCRHGMVNLYSPGDWFMGGWATETFGTMDRKKTSTAGRLGFRDPDGELARADGLTQIPWERQWRALGHDGGHGGWLSAAWAREKLAPEVKTQLRTTPQ